MYEIAGECESSCPCTSMYQICTIVCTDHWDALGYATGYALKFVYWMYTYMYLYTYVYIYIYIHIYIYILYMCTYMYVSIYMDMYMNVYIQKWLFLYTKCADCPRLPLLVPRPEKWRKCPRRPWRREPLSWWRFQWENHGKTIGKWWFNDGWMGFWWDFMGYTLW